MMGPHVCVVIYSASSISCMRTEPASFHLSFRLLLSSAFDEEAGRLASMTFLVDHESREYLRRSIDTSFGKGHNMSCLQREDLLRWHGVVLILRVRSTSFIYSTSSIVPLFSIYPRKESGEQANESMGSKRHPVDSEKPP